MENDPIGGHGYRYVWKAIYPDGDNGLNFIIPENDIAFKQMVDLNDPEHDYKPLYVYVPAQ